MFSINQVMYRESKLIIIIIEFIFQQDVLAFFYDGRLNIKSNINNNTEPFVINHVVIFVKRCFFLFADFCSLYQYLDL